MNIAVVGPHGVGKTTLVNQLSELMRKTGRNLAVINEIATLVAQKQGITNTNFMLEAPVDTRRAFQEDILKTQIEIENHHPKGFLSDRSTIDAVAYSELYGLNGSWLESYRRKAIRHTSNYDLLFYAPIPNDNNIVDDNFRLTDPKSQIFIDQKLRGMLSEVQTKVVMLSHNRMNWQSQSFNEIVKLNAEKNMLDRIVCAGPIKKGAFL